MGIFKKKLSKDKSEKVFSVLVNKYGVSKLDAGVMVRRSKYTDGSPEEIAKRLFGDRLKDWFLD